MCYLCHTVVNDREQYHNVFFLYRYTEVYIFHVQKQAYIRAVLPPTQEERIAKQEEERKQLVQQLIPGDSLGAVFPFDEG